MQIINATPHDVVIVNDFGAVQRVFKASGILIRLSYKTLQCGDFEGVPLTMTLLDDIVGLPPYQKGVYYIVSRIVKKELPDRQDLLVPNELVRNEDGQPIGAKGLSF